VGILDGKGPLVTEDVYDTFMAVHAKGLDQRPESVRRRRPAALTRRLLLMSTMEQWTATVCADLGLDPSSADLRAVLDLTRDVAHGVARPAAPLTAYLVGVAVGRGLALPDAAGRISALAAAWDGPTEEGA
jgi:Domain of unknown function (DUF6457)